MSLVQIHSVNSAPNVTFTAVPIGRSKLISELEEGAADVAIGSYPSLYANVKEQTLFREDYVCILPKVLAPDGILSLSDFKSLRSEEHTSELQSLMRISYAVFCLKKK